MYSLYEWIWWTIVGTNVSYDALMMNNNVMQESKKELDEGKQMSKKFGNKMHVTISFIAKKVISALLLMPCCSHFHTSKNKSLID